MRNVVEDEEKRGGGVQKQRRRRLQEHQQRLAGEKREERGYHGAAARAGAAARMSDVALEEVAGERPGSGGGSVTPNAVVNGDPATPMSPEDYVRILSAERAAIELQAPSSTLAIRLLAQGTVIFLISQCM
ncbi:hypothetical protein B566_EDAN006470 [Ephemera danica]|nr:hypothetical protein B566_EDAN006470 [Ephemera danica]